MTHYETIWTFRTKRFAVTLAVAPDEDVDLSWADAETLEKINDGTYDCVMFRVRVSLDGRTVAEDHLGGSVYADVRTFRDHFGMNQAGHGSYFSDMVKTAIAEARETLRTVPMLRRVNAGTR